MVAPILSTKLMGINIINDPLGWRGMYLVVLIATLIPIIPAIFSKFPEYKEQDQPMSIKSYIKNPTIWLIVLVLSFGVTCEMGVSIVVGNFLIGVITDLFKVIFTNIYSVEVGLKYRYSAGYIFIGICSLVCFLGTIQLIRLLRKKDKVL
ncbi:hypothetical protein [Clostridium sp. CCUG 7971]|uniref:hypothetical protein n=1 Tax=Clostridium sp. CCUG 7971 TaxID=2811414 RepID=UPI001ABAF8E2|nr:hypothetical protein [Clostridium sp. CCUG 7971]MBO3444403.1 hypothetical protein [Clostridium sp. CCUG 7971]